MAAGRYMKCIRADNSRWEEIVEEEENGERTENDDFIFTVEPTR